MIRNTASDTIHADTESFCSHLTFTLQSTRELIILQRVRLKKNFGYKIRLIPTSVFISVANCQKFEKLDILPNIKPVLQSPACRIKASITLRGVTPVAAAPKTI